jgi:uncharacterized UPF0160 family protein
MSFFSKKQTVVVHDGRFHADDIFAAATLNILLNGKIKIIRTRDESIISSADFVADVGGIHDPKLNRFDHHQKGGAGFRESGIPYAAFGLVWKEYGEKVCKSKEVALRIEQRLVSSIDASDNAVETYTPASDTLSPYTIQAAFGSFMPTWKEGDSTDEQFLSAVKIAESILRREIKQAQDYLEAKQKIHEIYLATEDKRVITLERAYPWEEILTAYPEPIFVIVSRSGNRWKAEGTLVGKGFDRKAYFPASWAGLRDEALEKASGVVGAKFCHNGRFIAVGATREAVEKMVQIALESQ